MGKKISSKQRKSKGTLPLRIDRSIREDDLKYSIFKAEELFKGKK
jgi:hypothetical protein